MRSISLIILLLLSCIALPRVMVMHFADAVVVYEADGFEHIGGQLWQAVNPSRKVYTPAAYCQWRLKELVDKGKWTSVYDLRDFAAFARAYIPCVPQLPEDETQDPNLPYTEGICYTVGGKHHLYADCRHLKDKQWSPTICDPNNICLTCVARKARED